ncbi:Mu transposase C-terminal domain-containing protein, partial [Staphylococcus haemolyticus]
DTPSDLIDFQNFEEKLRYFLIEDYNQKEHSAIHTTPINRWNSNHFFPNMPSSLEQLDLLLLEIPKSRKIHSDGIHFQGFRYSNTNLAAYVGEYVLIRYNPNDMAEIRVFYRDEFLCTAISPDLADYSIDIKDIQHARSQRRKHLKQNIASPSTTDLIKEEKNYGYSPQETTKNIKKLKRYRND